MLYDTITSEVYIPVGIQRKRLRRNAKDTAIAYLESSIKHHDPILLGSIMRKESGEMWGSPTKRVIYHTEDLTVACAI